MSIRRLLSISLPAIAISISRTLMQFVDFMFVSELGTEAVAAITPAGMVVWLIIGFGMGLVATVGTFASQALGSGKNEEVGKYVWQSLWASVWIGALATLCIPWVHLIFQSFGHEEKVYQLETLYAEIVLWSSLPSIAAFAVQNFLISIERPYWALASMVIANLSNLVLDYALIYGVWGFPEWGFAGAAWATVIASIVQLVVSLAVLYQPSFDRTYKIFAWQNVRWNGEAFRRFHVLGLPSGLTWIMDILAWSVFVNYLVGSLGTVALAASNIVLQFLHISFMPAMGIGQALVGLVGQAIGEKRPEEAVRYTNLATVACMAWMGTMGLLVFVFGQKIASFVNLEAAATAGAIFKVAAIFQLFDAVAIINSSALRAAGDTHFPAWVSLVANWLVFVAGGWVVLRLFPEWGAVGPWATGTVMIIVIGLIFRWRFMARGWLKIDIFKS